MRVFVPLFLAAALVSACAIPERANPFDSANAPSAVVRVVQLAPPGQPCVVTASSGFEVIEASRGACLALDASASTDPQDDSLKFEFEYEDPSGNWTSLDRPQTADSLTLDSAFRLSAPVSTGDVLRPLRFRVRAEDSGRAEGTSEPVSLVLRNGKPIAVTDGAMTLPVGGTDWARGLPVTVALDAKRSFDPDGETDLEFRWEVVDQAGDVAVLDWSTAAVQFRDVDPTGGVVRATLRVRDGIPGGDRAESLPTSQILSIHAPEVWTGTSKETGPFENVDGERRELGVSAVSEVFGASFRAGTGGVGCTILLLGAAGTGLAHYCDDVLVAINGLSETDPEFLVGDASRRRVWAGFKSGTDMAVYRFDLDAAGQLVGGGPVFGPVLFALSADGNADQPDVLEDGSLIVPGEIAGRLLVLDPDDGTITRRIDFGGELTSAAHRPGTDEIWVVRVESFVGATAPAMIHVVETDGALLWTVEAPSPLLFGLRWIDGEQLWLTEFGIAVHRLDAKTILSGGSFEDAVQLTVPTLVPLIKVQLDPLSGTLWAEDFVLGGTLSFDPNGRLRSRPKDVEPIVVDALGRLWWKDPVDDGLWRGRDPDGDGIVSRHPAFFSLTADVEAGTGRLGTIGLIPSVFERVTPDGTRVDLPKPLFWFDENGAALPSRSAAVFRFTPGSSDRGWIATGPFLTPYGPEIFQWLESDTAIFATRVLADATVGYPALAPLAPPESDTRAWLIKEDSEQISLVSNTGVVSVVLDLSSESIGRLVAAPSHFSNTLCVATQDDVAGETRLRRVSLTGIVENLHTLPLTATTSFNIVGVSTAVVGGLDVCWYAIEEDGGYSIFGFSGPGQMVASNSFGEPLNSIQAVSGDDLLVWATREDSSIPQRSRISFMPVAGIDEIYNFPLGDLQRRIISPTSAVGN